LGVGEFAYIALCACSSLLKSSKLIPLIFILSPYKQSISVATLAHRKEEDNASRVSNNNDMNMNQIKKESNDAYGKLRDAAMKAYHSLVVYGSSSDLSAQSVDKENNSNNVVQLSDVRRSRLLEMGRKLWMTIRNNPDLFNDMISQDSKVSVADGSGDFVTSFEGLKSKAIAGGYARAVAARLVFLNYIDTRCSVGSSAPQLHPVSNVASKSTASLQELVFGLKLFSRAGRVILEHNKDARASFDSLSLAVSCFDNISTMATNGNGEAADQLKDIIEEAFHAISMLSNSASLFGQLEGGGGDRIPRKKDAGKNVAPWQSLVIRNLELAESFVDAHCNVSTSTSKLATLSHYLPSLSRLSLKHGSHFLKLGKEHENAKKALRIALSATNQCLSEVRKELDQESKSPKSRQMLQNLEKEMVVVSIESFFMLSASYQSSGEKKKALMCLDSVEKYTNEQNDRDNALQTNITNTLSSGKDFVFSEDAATSALEGSKSHFDKDKSDINNRLQTAHEDARSRQAAERATLTFSRIMVLHKSNPSSDDESMIDQKMKELVELALQFTDVSSSGFGSAQHTVTPTTNADKIFDLAIECIRRVHVRRTISTVSSGGNDMENTYADNYQLLLHKLPKTHFRRPFVMLDKLNAMLAVEFQVRESKIGDAKSIRRLDSEALQTAKEYLAIVKTFSRGGTSRDSADTTLFAASTQSLSTDLLEDTKQALCTAVSLYHTLEAHDMCAQWSDLLENVIQLSNKRSMSLEDDTDDLLGRIMTVKAHALSMSGNHTLGLQTAREAWTKVKNVDSMVTLFHCNLANEKSSPNNNTMLEFDSALNELLSAANETTVDDVLAAFPRLSNSCVENEMSGSEVMLLLVQERWIDFLIGSKTFNQCLKDKDVSSSEISTEHSLFDILRAYLNNFEHVVSFKKDDSNFSMSSNFEALCRIIDGVLKLLVQVRDTKKMIPQKKTTGRRKKTKSADDAAEKSDVVVLVWDDQTIKTLVGERSDCVWTAEQLWNIGNQLMAISLGEAASVEGSRSDKDARGIAAEVFAASHDFCILSEEEEGSSLSKGYLDYDVKFDPTKSVLPKFDKSPNERLPCDISSEFSGQCLLISVAAAADYASHSMFNNSSKGVGHVDNDVHILLSRSLHRLAHAQEEMLLNCEDESQLNEVNKMTSLLALRCLLGVGDDGQASAALNEGLAEALRKIHTDEQASSSSSLDEDESTQFVILRNVKLLADAAEVKSMSQTSTALNRICSSMLQQTNKFEVDIGGYTVSLGEIQRKIIELATSVKDVMEVFQEVSSTVEKKHKGNEDGYGGEAFYSTGDLTWFATEAYNRALSLKMIGDSEAKDLFSFSLNLLPLCNKEFQSYRSVINAAFTHANTTTSRDTLGSIWNLVE